MVALDRIRLIDPANEIYRCSRVPAPSLEFLRGEGMEKKGIKIKSEKVEAGAELNDSRVANLIWDSLPIKASVNTWGDEIYFTIPVKTGSDNPVEVVREGDIAYWPQGTAFCIFFGPTPVSTPTEIRPASAVEIVGRIEGDPREFSEVVSGETIIIEKKEG